MADTPRPPIPDKPAFKAAEVCDIAGIQPYVLRSWESEFPDLGVSRTPGGARIYRRADVERVLSIRDLVFSEGLTLAGVRRRFDAENPQPEDAAELLPFAEPATTPQFNDATRAQILKIKQELRSLLDLLDTREGVALKVPQAAAGGRRPARRP
jgi:DNA-binding transcriptional MerR regulator